ncbi:MAG: hypothetical protein Q8808_02710, partial [Candidatus Phytoplasma australasiaticum]|nr:hypothetical protein [Candidatus Phytoplasma australasiaticum]
REKYFEIIQLLDQIMTNFESNGHFLKVFYETKFSEDFINSYILLHIYFTYQCGMWDGDITVKV